MNKKIIFFLLLAAVLSGYLLLFSEDNKFNGSALAAAQGEIVLSAGYGYADREKDIKNTPQTQFLISSITKVFTAAAILKLEEEGKLQDSSPVAAYLPPSDRLWAGMPPAWIDEVTIHHLLTHSSGLQYRDPLSDSLTIEEFIRFLASFPLNFKPGTKYLYSGAGYDLLGIIIERVSGQSYGHYLEQAFFKPLGMDSTFCANTGSLSETRKDDRLLAVGYNGTGKPAADINMTMMFAEASIISTTIDLYAWSQAFFKGKVISPASLKKMITPNLEIGRGKIWMGEGIYIDAEDPSHLVYYHNGRTDGFESVWMYEPIRDIHVILLSNENEGATFDWALELLDKEQKRLEKSPSR
jgi:CubicO group peptidase (beta-lactamase class C family)